MKIDKEESKQREKEEFKECQENIQGNAILNFTPQRFLIKIPNVKVIREFFINQGKYYAPPLRGIRFIKSFLFV